MTSRTDRLPSADVVPDEPIAPARDTAAADRRAAARRQWELTFQSATRGVAISDVLTGRIETVNTALAVMHAGVVEDFVGTTSLSLVNPEWLQHAPEWPAQASRDGHVSRELDHVRKDGTSFPVLAESITTRDADGEPQFRIEWFEDLTDQRAEDRLAWQARRMFEVAFADAPSGIALIGLDQRFVLVNAALCEMLGRPESELVGTPTIEYCHPDDYEKTLDSYEALSATADRVAVEKRYVRPDGTVVWASCVGIVVRDPSGAALNIVTHFHDVTAVKLAEHSQTEAYQRFETAFADAPVGMGLVGLDSHWIRVNRALCELTGYSEAQLLKRSFRDITHPDDIGADLQQVDRLLSGEIDRYTMEKRYIRANGEELWVNLAVSLVRDVNGNAMHFIRQSEDISERKRLQESVQHLADHDSLTGLWNRRRFEEELQMQISRCQRYGESAAVLLVDLNGFKRVNDTYGHRVGDELLQQIASALRQRLRASDSVARLGGDEFGVVLTKVGENETTELARALREIVGDTIVNAGHTDVGVTTSVGVVMLGEGTMSAEAALGDADSAMYRDKATHVGVQPERVD
jgi:diguanylate cyclase (GGDEF)-like protein/PAS domain S-box-containing protein